MQFLNARKIYRVADWPKSPLDGRPVRQERVGDGNAWRNTARLNAWFYGQTVKAEAAKREW